jgi:hypothetical protein
MRRALAFALLVVLAGCAGGADADPCVRADEARARWQAAFDAARACDPNAATSCSPGGYVRELCGCEVPAAGSASLRAAADAARDEALQASLSCSPGGLVCPTGCVGAVGSANAN